MLLSAMGLNPKDTRAIKDLSQKAEVPHQRLKFYDEQGIEPSIDELKRLAKVIGISELELRLKSGFINRSIIEKISKNAHSISNILEHSYTEADLIKKPKIGSETPIFKTKLGALYQGDCLNVMANLPSNSIDLIFADPPFNLDKLYPSEIDDNLRTEQYLLWCEELTCPAFFDPA